MQHAFRSRSTRLGATIATVGVVALGAVSALSASAATGRAAAAEPAPVCTGYDTDGFTIFVQDDVDLGNSETEGSLALGGDLTLAADTNLVHSTGLTPAGYTLPVVDGDPTRLLVGGTLDLTAPGSLQVTSRDDVGPAQADRIGAIKFGDTGGLELTARSGVDRLHEAGGSVDAKPWVDVNDAAQQTFDGAHAVTYPGAASVVDSRFPALVAQGEALRTATGSDVATATLDGGVVTLTPGKLNVLTVDAATLGANAQLTFAGGTPGADTPFVVNVTDASGSTVHVPPLRGPEMPGQPSATDPNPWAPFVTWNLTGAGTTTVTGELVTGTILAPDVDLTLDASSPVEGQIVARSLVARGGEIHQYLAASSCTTPTPTPTATETTTTPAPTTPAPTPTESTTTPTPTGTTTSPAPVPSSTTTSPAPVVPVTSATPTATVLGTGGTAPSSPGNLATTGASLVGPLVAGVALVAAGLALLLVRRRTARG
ncbi:collagen-binding domain-containing protein [Luteimicrobium sp. NPDC057192]|uniref:collagen-binding domain-containing protein n=1 Tax=Luteimicrobium sp. NPDC057192 TaxID=3346042 RepID=UPI00363C9781